MKVQTIFGFACVMLFSFACATTGDKVEDDESIYSPYRQRNTVEAYQKFISKYPDNSYVADASERIKYIKYMEVKGEADSLAVFIQKYNGHPFVECLQKNDAELYDNFIKNYPESPFAAAATTERDRLQFQPFAEQGSAAALQQFIKEHPDNTFNQSALELIKVYTSQQDSTVNKMKLVSEAPSRMSILGEDFEDYPVIKLYFDYRETSNNRFIKDLRIEDIRLSEDGEEVDILSLKLIESKSNVPVDFVFMIDNSGSMYNDIQTLEQNINSFVDALAARGIDARIAFAHYSDRIYHAINFTTNLNRFKSQLVLSSHGSGFEDPIVAVREATRFPYRTGAIKQVLWMTDEHFYYDQRPFLWGKYGLMSLQDVLNRLTELAGADNTIFNTVVDMRNRNEGFSEFASTTNGYCYDINQSLVDILNRIGRSTSYLYELTYRRKQPEIYGSSVLLRTSDGARASQEVELAFDDVYFDFDRSVLRKDEKGKLTKSADIFKHYLSSLQTTVKILKKNPFIKISLKGHTCDIGPETYNFGLSKRRANRVYSFLKKQDIASKRMKKSYFGEFAFPRELGADVGNSYNNVTRIRNRNVKVLLVKDEKDPANFAALATPNEYFQWTIQMETELAADPDLDKLTSALKPYDLVLLDGDKPTFGGFQTKRNANEFIEQVLKDDFENLEFKVIRGLKTTTKK
ncbi:MAG: OmpA family protein [bacterium]